MNNLKLSAMRREVQPAWDYMERAMQAKRKADNVEEAVKILLADEGHISSPSSGDTVKTSPKGDAAFVDPALRWVELTNRLAEMRGEQYDLCQEALAIVEQIRDPSHHRILLLRCVNLLSWGEIQEAMSYSSVGAYKLYIRALSEVMPLLPK